MTSKPKPPPFTPQEGKTPRVRIDGSLSGEALIEREALERLREVVAALSARRPYTYDLELAAGRFNVMVVEPVIPRDAFVPDPEGMIAEDLQNILDALPPPKRSGVRSTFRVLWSEGGEVSGVGFLVEPPGRIVVKKRTRPEEAYDRLWEEQATGDFYTPPKPILPKWAAYLLGLLVLAAGFYLIYSMGPEPYFEPLEAALLQVELPGLDRLIEIGDPKVGFEGAEFTVIPLPGCWEKLQASLEPPGGRNQTAASALLKGRLTLEIFDETGVLLDRVPFTLEGFDGTAAVPVRTRSIRLTARPASARISP